MTELVVALGAILVVRSMSRNQNRREEHTNSIIARLQGQRQEIFVETTSVNDHLEETDEVVPVNDEADLVPSEHRTLAEANITDEYPETLPLTPTGIEVLVEKMTRESGTYAIAKSGDYIAGLENL